MKTKLVLSLGVAVLSIATSATLAGFASAQTAPTSTTATSNGSAPLATGLANIQYPIASLGGCTSQSDCKAYCDQLSHIDACVAFAKAHNVMPPAELQQAEQVQAAIAKGVKPPACNSKSECDAYCSQPNHMKECITFGEASGMLQGQELQNAQRVLAAINAGATPPPCTQDTCDAYCSQPTHMEACMTFAQAAGLMSPQEAADSQKVLAAIQKGVNPPPCKGKGACDAYCSQPEHVDECTNFAVAAGFMTPQDAALAKKTGGKGPGGCTSKEACDTFCKDPQNQQTCFSFAKDNDLIPPEQLQQMQQGQEQLQQSLQNAPQAVLTCLEDSVGPDVLDKIKSGNFMPTQDMGSEIGQCFQQGIPQGPQFASGTGSNIPPGAANGVMHALQGPGGCTTPESCQAYCQSNPDACKNFQAPSGEGQAQPGQMTQIQQGEIRQNMQYQGGPGGASGTMPFPQGMPLQNGQPLNNLMPQNGQMMQPGTPPQGVQPPTGIQEMLPPGTMQTPPPPGTAAPASDTTAPPPAVSPSNPPSSFLNGQNPFGTLIKAFSTFLGH